MGFEYGALNIGDDFMIDGFRRGMQKLFPGTKISAMCLNEHSQRHRFPDIEWNPHKINPLEHVWTIVGTTPFQMSSGSWCIDRLMASIPSIKFFKHRVLTSVGAETEALQRTKEFSTITSAFERISTRNMLSKEVIEKLLGTQQIPIFAGADTANLSLETLARSQDQQRKHKIGIIVNSGDYISEDDLKEVRRFAEKIPGIAFLACQTAVPRPMFERDIHAARFADLGPILVPDYDGGTLESFLALFQQCDTIISSRYHGGLIAAWCGCRVALIGRNSKLTSLSHELDVPCVKLPIRAEDIEIAIRNAPVVPRQKLLGLYERALEGLTFAFDF